MGFFFIGLIILLYYSFNEGTNRMSINEDLKQRAESSEKWNKKFQSAELTSKFYRFYWTLENKNMGDFQRYINILKSAEKRFQEYEVTKRFIKGGYITGEIVKDDAVCYWGCDILLSESGKVPSGYGSSGHSVSRVFANGYSVPLNNLEYLIILKWIQRNMKYFGAGDLIYDGNNKWIWKDRDGIEREWNHREYIRNSKRRIGEDYKYWYYTLDEYLREKCPGVLPKTDDYSIPPVNIL